MKRILFALMTLAALCACNENVCTISGTLTDPVDSVRLVDMSGDVLDVADVINGAFTLKCEINPETSVSIIRVALPTEDMYDAEGYMDYDPIPLIPDVKKIKVAIVDGQPEITGSPLSKENQDFSQWAFDTFFEGVNKAMELMEKGDTIGAQNIQTESLEQIANYSREVYQKHKADAIGMQALGFMMDFIDKEEFIALYEQGGKAVKADANLGGYYEHLKSMPEEAVITLLESGEIVKEQGMRSIATRVWSSSACR